MEEARFKEQALRRTLDEAFRTLDSEVATRVRLIESKVLLRAVERELASRKPEEEKGSDN